MKKEKSFHFFELSKKPNSYFLGIFLSLFLIAFDQLTKYLAVIFLKGKAAFPVIKNVFELMYLEGRDREQRKAPYRQILKSKPMSYRLKNFVKSYMPGLQSAYRRHKGFGDD